MEILMEAAKSGYVKKYPCPYCGAHFDRQKLIRHVEMKHPDEIPEGYSPTRVVFNLINKKDHGNCVICGKETKCDENKARYDRICERPECMNEYRNRTKENMIRVYGTDNLLKDPQQQQRMLANRKISGKYKWSDNTLKGYTGSYEKKTLEFLDKVMEYKSEDVLTPGPIIEYEYNGTTHFWITDIYLPSYQLCIDVKDGGNNANRRPMREYREKQIAKEKAIIDQKQYSYLRLTDNNFGQLMSILAELKMQLMDNDSTSRIARINENMFAGIGAMFPMGNWNQDNGDTYIVNYMQNNIFSGIGITNNPKFKKLVIQDSTGMMHVTDEKFLENTVYSVYLVHGQHQDIYNKMIEEAGQVEEPDHIIRDLFGYDPITGDEFLAREDVEEIPDYYSYLEACWEAAGASINTSDGRLVINETYYDPDNTIRVKQDRIGRYYLENSITGIRSVPKRSVEEFTEMERKVIENGIL